MNSDEPSPADAARPTWFEAGGTLYRHVRVTEYMQEDGTLHAYEAFHRPTNSAHKVRHVVVRAGGDFGAVLRSWNRTVEWWYREVA